MNLLPYTFLSCGAPLATATLSALIAHAALPARVLVASAPPPPPAAQTLPVATSDDIASIAAAHNLPLAYTGADTDAAIRAALGQCGTLVLIDEATRLEGMVPNRHLDLIREDVADHRAGKLGTVDLLVLSH